MRGQLLLALGTISLALGCGDRRSDSNTGNTSGGTPSPAGPNAVDTIIRLSNVAASSSKDTLVAHASAARDTFVAHVAAPAPAECLKFPRPPECPPLVKAMRIDTIPRP